METVLDFYLDGYIANYIILFWQKQAFIVIVFNLSHPFKGKASQKHPFPETTINS